MGRFFFFFISKVLLHYDGIDMSPVHHGWPKPSCKAQWEGKEDKADRKKEGKTIISGNGQARSSPSPRGQCRTEKTGGNWL